MPLSDANWLHENNGTTATGTNHVVSLAGADSTAAGSTVVVCFTVGPGTGLTLPSGFVLAKSQAVVTQVVYKSDVAASETSWTFTTGIAVTTTWYVAEVSNVDLVDVFDVTAGVTTSGMGNAGTASTGTTALNAGLYSAALAVLGTITTTTSNTVSWSGYTNGFAEVVDLDASNGVKLAAARLFESSTTRTFETTATLATDDTARTVNAVMVVFRAADSPVVAPLHLLAGFDWLTHGGINSHSGVTSMTGTQILPVTGTFGTSFLIQSGSARNSSGGLRIVQSAAAAQVRWGYLHSVTQRGASYGFNTRVVSATGTVVVAEFTNDTGASSAQLLYDTSGTRFGVRAGTTGTSSWQAGSTALNTWVWVDARVKIRTSTWLIEWRLETAANTYTDQTSASLTGQSVTLNLAELGLGGNVSQTMTADYDDAVISRYFSAFPLGPHQIRCLTVDPAGTPTVTTSSLFSTFASNGTLTAWNATTARNALDDVPVTVSAAADGVVQTAVGATDYMQFPMADYTLGPTEFVNGVRMLAPLWSGTGAGAGDLAIRGYDGTTETALATASQITPGSPTAISATAPVWRTAMWQSPNGWTQAELNALALRVGFSGDATPDMGVSALYLEVAIGRTRTSPVFGDVTSTAEVDPTRLGVVSVTATAPAMGTGDSSLVYEVSGTPATVPIAEGATVTTQINAVMQADVNRVTVYWPPEPEPTE